MRRLASFSCLLVLWAGCGDSGGGEGSGESGASPTTTSETSSTTFIEPSTSTTTVGSVVVNVGCGILSHAGPAIATLAAISLSGAEGVWHVLWSIGAVRVLYLAIVLGLVGWVFVVAGWSLGPQLGPRRAAGVALAGVGAVFALPTATAAAIGTTEALRGWKARGTSLVHDHARLMRAEERRAEVEGVRALLRAHPRYRLQVPLFLQRHDGRRVLAQAREGERLWKSAQFWLG